VNVNHPGRRPRHLTGGLRQAVGGRLILPVLIVMLAATACAKTQTSESTEPAATALSPSATAANQSPASQPTTEEPDTVTAVRITVADQTVIAQLADNPTAQDLAEQLPLTLTFRDLNRVEKIAKLPRPLTMEGVPPGDDPEINDIGYYAPSGDLVFYYGDVGYWNGIVRIGRFNDGDMDLIERQPDGFQVTIELAP
jgi:hypothetical protein